MSDPIEQPALTTVPTALLRKRRVLNKERVARAIEKKIADKKRIGKKKGNFKRAEYFVNESFKTVMTDKRLGRLKHKVVRVPETVKILFIMRMAKIAGPMPEKIRKILQSLRLNEMNNAVLVRCDENAIEKIKIVEPYVTWGYPSLRSIHDLIFKYGYGEVDGIYTSLSSNVLIENKFSKEGLLCLDDVVKEIFAVGTHFDMLNEFMYPFKLTPPKGGFRRTADNFSKNGAWGNRAEKINTLVRKML